MTVLAAWAGSAMSHPEYPIDPWLKVKGYPDIVVLFNASTSIGQNVPHALVLTANGERVSNKTRPHSFEVRWRSDVERWQQEMWQAEWDRYANLARKENEERERRGDCGCWPYCRCNE